MKRSLVFFSQLGPKVGGRPGGFSLIEVTLALGIVSFGLLAVLGLIPVGLTTLRGAIDQTVESQIVRAFGAKMQLTPFSQLSTNYSEKTFYRDEEGKEASGVSEARYKVLTDLIPAVYPGSSNAPVGTPAANSIQVLRMDIVKIQGIPKTNRYQITVPNSGN